MLKIEIELEQVNNCFLKYKPSDLMSKFHFKTSYLVCCTMLYYIVYFILFTMH